MRRFLKCTAAAALGFVLVGAVEAGDKGGRSGGSSSGARVSGSMKSGPISGSSFKSGSIGASTKSGPIISKSGPVISKSTNGPANGGIKTGPIVNGSKNGPKSPIGNKVTNINGNKNWSGKFKHAHVTKDYCFKHGHKFSHGWCYTGKNHCHWNCWSWNPHWGCYNYWCPSAHCWYYWYEPHLCYYPISYIPVCTPVAYASPEVVPASAAPLINGQASATNGNAAPAAPVPGVLPPPQP
jgi:hypothetical protein